MRPRLPVVVLLAALLAGCDTARSTGTPPGATAPPATQAPSGTSIPTTPAGSDPAATNLPAESHAPVDLGSIAVTLEPFVTVAGGPLAMAAAKDGSNRLFVAAQDGRIWVVENGSVRRDPMVDLARQIRSGGEQGLLGLALHPRFPEDPRVFVNFTDTNGDTVVASLTLNEGDPNRLDPGSLLPLLFVDQPFANHNGGATLFGPDGYLYTFLGDGGSGGDPQNNGQSRQELLGKVLRIDVDRTDGPSNYAIPPDNPFVEGAGRDEIWHLGLRNPWRASFDRATGDLWIGDVGQNAWEEIDVARRGEGGLNFGWNRMEGSHCFPAGDDCVNGLYTLPVSEYGRDQGCTVIGGHVYRGSAYPALVGAYLFADYCTGRIFAIDSAVTELTEPVTIGSGPGQISGWGEDAAGELYLMSLNGDVSRVVASPR